MQPPPFQIFLLLGVLPTSYITTSTVTISEMRPEHRVRCPSYDILLRYCGTSEMCAMQFSSQLRCWQCFDLFIYSDAQHTAVHEANLTPGVLDDPEGHRPAGVVAGKQHDVVGGGGAGGRRVDAAGVVRERGVDHEVDGNGLDHHLLRSSDTVEFANRAWKH